jgi:hypothetical protein
MMGQSQAGKRTQDGLPYLLYPALSQFRHKLTFDDGKPSRYCLISAGLIIMLGQLLQVYFLPPEPWRAWSEWQVSFQP